MTAPRGGAGARGALGIDVGAVRVGLAAADETGTIASPVATLPRRARGAWQRIEREIRERHASTLVVGLPLLLDGSEGEAARDARAFAAELGSRTDLAVEMWDERFTTAQAERSLIAGGMRRRRRRERVDAVAAALLLQSWLDREARRGSPG